MTTYNNIDDTIHGAHIDSHARKFEWKGMKANPYTDEMMTLYEGDRNSYAEIVKACSEKDKENKNTSGFHAEVGDCLEADAISIYIRRRRKHPIEVKEGVTGRHGSNILCPRDYTICTIKTPLANLIKWLEKEKGLINRNNIIEKK